MSDPPVPDLATTAGLGAWWDEVSTCALVGTGRRPVPQPPPALVGALEVQGPSDPDAGNVPDHETAEPPVPPPPVVPPPAPETHTHPEVRLLDQIAIGIAWQSGGVEPTRPETLDPAPAETRPPAPPRALQLLDLVLTQSPAGPGATDVLVGHWVEAAQAHGVRVPPALVPALLDHALRRAGSGTTRPGVGDARVALIAVTGERGRWLAGLDPQWRSLLPTPATSGEGTPEAARGLPDDWLQLPLPEQIARLARLRTTAPELVRDAVAQGCRSGSARERTAYLGVLADGLGAQDEELLEHALSDRAAGVREEAARLLGRLPGSARATRMGERLRPLITVSTRLLRKKVAVLLPDPPDPVGVRDGLGKPPRGRSARGHHLTEIIAGAPLDVWLEVTGLEPGRILTGLEETEDVIPGLRRAAATQRDPVWARALLEHGQLHPALLEVLDPGEAERLVAERLRGATAQEGAIVLERIPGPWGPDLSAAALAHLAQVRPKEAAAQTIAAVGARLHPTVLPALREAVERIPFGPARDGASRVVTLATLRQSISEAFT